MDHRHSVQACWVFSNGIQVDFAMVAAFIKTGALSSALCPLSRKVPGPTVFTDADRDTNCQAMVDRVYMKKADMQGLL